MFIIFLIYTSHDEANNDVVLLTQIVTLRNLIIRLHA